MPGLTRQSNWHRSNTKNNKHKTFFLVFIGKIISLTEPQTVISLSVLAELFCVCWQNPCCQLIFASSLIQIGWTKRPWDLFCSVLIVLTATDASELTVADTESESTSSRSLSRLHMMVVRVTQVTRRRQTRAIRRERMTSDVRGAEVLCSGSVTAARGWWLVTSVNRWWLT